MGRRVHLPVVGDDVVLAHEVPAPIVVTPRRITSHRRTNIVTIDPDALPRDAGAHDPACVYCGRRRSVHDAPIDVGDGEPMLSACAQLRHAAYPYGPPTPRPRPMAARLSIARSMPLLRARAIAGTLGAPSKMPGAAYGIDAFQCKVGGKLAEIPGSVCFGCYARRNFYRYWWPAVKARAHRQASLTHEYWVEAMIAQIEEYMRAGGEPYFRWHDSGDLQSVEHLQNIVAVAEATPGVRQWLPTREYRIVLDYRAAGGWIPPNLIIRLSAHHIDEVPKMPRGLHGMLTSTVHRHTLKPVQVSARRKDSIECKAYMHDGKCGPCRACWDPRVKNVSYPQH